MKAILKPIFDFFRKLHKRNPQILLLIVMLFVWVVSIPILQLIDPTSGVFDAGIFQIPVFTIILFVIFLLVSWVTMKMIFGELHRFAKGKIKESFKSLTAWQQIVIFYSVYFALFFALVLLARVLVVTPIR
jgi:hypothetical protein